MHDHFLSKDTATAVGEPVWRFPGQQESIIFTLLADDILRIALTPHDAPPHRTWAVEPQSDARRASAFVIEQDDETALVVRTSALTLSIERQTRVFFCCSGR